MHFVDRKTFLAQSEGTIYQEYTDRGLGPLMRKHETIHPNDWIEESIQPDITNVEGADDFVESLTSIEQRVADGQPFRMERSSCRNGLFDTEGVYLIYDELDVALLVQKLTKNPVA
jgi:hypothetical protein